MKNQLYEIDNTLNRNDSRFDNKIMCCSNRAYPKTFNAQYLLLCIYVYFYRIVLTIVMSRDISAIVSSDEMMHSGSNISMMTSKIYVYPYKVLMY